MPYTTSGEIPFDINQALPPTPYWERPYKPTKPTTGIDDKRILFFLAFLILLLGPISIYYLVMWIKKKFW